MSFFAALRFLTIIPGPGHMEPGLSRPTRVAVSADAPVAVDISLLQVGRSIAYFPVVGLIIGIILSLLYYGLHIILPSPVVSAVILAALAIITGAHHLDGLMDACDGMVAGKTKEERLAIMSDTRVGAFGITGACVILILKYAAISSSLTPAMLIAFPVISRWALTGAILIFPPAKTSGAGFAIKSSAGWPGYILATLVALAISIVLNGLVMGTTILACVLALIYFAGLILTRLYGGLSGDCYGALVEIGEVLALLLYIILTRFMPSLQGYDLLKIALPA
ncbi:MAG: adenosylcobinamide-GDP ribazoletransferase [Chloroflexi bacterium]|nr:adenosylcobinamide-GDP ribazoletransferase [Chloroflexota bacterium]